MSAQFPELEDTGKYDIPDDPDRVVGNATDPDAEVIDSLYRDQGNPPTDNKPYAPNAPTQHPKPITRMITGLINMALGDEAQLLLPADPNRVELNIKIGPTAQPGGVNDRVLISDDRGKVQSEMGAFALYQGERYSGNEPHTGPVWVKVASLATGTVPISFCAVTS